MKVLHFTNKPYFPILDGGRLASHHLLLNLLDLEAEVKNLTICTHKHPFLIEHFPEKKIELIEPEAVHIDTKINFFDGLKSFIKGEAYNLTRFRSTELENKLIDLLKDNYFDFIIVESIFLLLYLPIIRKNSDAKIIVRTHNVEYRLWKQSAKKEKSFFKKYYFNKISNQLKKFELSVLNQVDGILCITENDRDFFRRRGIKTRMIAFPVFMDVKKQYEVDYSTNDFCFIGSMNWKPNIEAVNWIAYGILPKIKKMYPDIKIHIAGSNMSSSMKRMGNQNLIIHGRVEDVYHFMSKHGTLLVPLKTGSGVRIKILEALSAGIPIIATDKAKEGILVTSKKEYLGGNMSEEIILQMKNCINNQDFKLKLGENAKLFIEEHYSRNKITSKLSEFLSKL
ncbi:MAG: glycosyltransferase [Flavobacteriia bacterium]|nr:glycosyltransferase [Flavobacteriia bacterium]